ncbi:uncharacterized protein LOC141860187 isoform X1 [Acropora palmata]
MVVSRFRVLAITHLVVGALLIIFGIFDGVTSLLGDDFMFWSPFGLFGISTGTGQWLGVTGSKCQMCIAGSLGIPGSTPQRTRMRSCFACLFMVFSITSALFGGVILLFYSKEIASASCRRYYNNYHYYNNYYYGYGHGKSTLPKGYPSYSYDAKMGLAALILTVGIIEFVTGFWLSVCLWVMIPCCTADSEEREPLITSTVG